MHVEMHVKIHARSSGRGAVGAAAYQSGTSIVAKAAYRSGEQLRSERHEQTYDYRKKDDILYTEILAPEDAPDWVHDRTALWNEVERKENRKNSQLAREALLILPRELSTEQMTGLVQGYVKDTFVSQGMIADVAIHSPLSSDGDRNPHAHVLLTMRGINADGWEARKNGAHLGQLDAKGKVSEIWNRKETLEHWRSEYQRYVNDALEGAGVQYRADLRSNKDKGLERIPQAKKGPGNYIEEAQKQSRNLELYRERQRRNAMIDAWHRQAKQAWAREGDWIHNSGWHGVNVAVASSQNAMQAAGPRHQEVQQRLEQQHAEKRAQQLARAKAREQQYLMQQAALAQRKALDLQRQKSTMRPPRGRGYER